MEEWIIWAALGGQTLIITALAVAWRVAAAKGAMREQLMLAAGQAIGVAIAATLGPKLSHLMDQIPSASASFGAEAKVEVVSKDGIVDGKAKK